MPHYVYLIQEREFIDLIQPVYKVGKTTQPDLKRFKSYPNGSELLFHSRCYDCTKAEKNILKVFRSTFVSRKDIGAEYFEGNVWEMLNIMHKSMSQILFPSASPTESPVPSPSPSPSPISNSIESKSIESNTISEPVVPVATKPVLVKAKVDEPVVSNVTKPALSKTKVDEPIVPEVTKPVLAKAIVAPESIVSTTPSDEFMKHPLPFRNLLELVMTNDISNFNPVSVANVSIDIIEYGDEIIFGRTGNSKYGWIREHGHIWKSSTLNQMRIRLQDILSWFLRENNKITPHNVTEHVYQTNMKALRFVNAKAAERKFYEDVLSNIISNLQDGKTSKALLINQTIDWIPCENGDAFTPGTMFNPKTWGKRKNSTKDYYSFVVNASIVELTELSNNRVEELLGQIFDNEETRVFTLGRLGLALCGVSLGDMIVFTGSPNSGKKILLTMLTNILKTPAYKSMKSSMVNDGTISFQEEVLDKLKECRILCINGIPDIALHQEEYSHLAGADSTYGVFNQRFSTFIDCEKLPQTKGRTDYIKIVNFKTQFILNYDTYDPNESKPRFSDNDHNIINNEESRNYFFTLLMHYANELHELYKEDPNYVPPGIVEATREAMQ